MRLVGLLVAIVAGVGAFLILMKLQKGDQETTKVVEVEKVVVQEVATVDILVARAPITIGSPIDSGMLDRQPWPSHLVLDDFIVSDGTDKDVVGMVTRSTFQAREPIIRSKLSNPSDPSFLAAGLDKGMRAVTMSVDMLSSVAGFVFPGDHVDVLINHRVILGKVDPNDPRSADKVEDIMETLIPNVKVIAIDQAAAAVAGQGPRVPASVTVQVNKQDAQKLKLGESRGKLTLALRPLSEDDTEVARPTGVNDLTRILPPSYFPILYDASGDYSAVLVNPFTQKVETQGDSKASGELRDKVQKELGKMKPGESAAALAAPGTTGLKGAGSDESEGSKAQDKITIVRGTQKEQVGVPRP